MKPPDRRPTPRLVLAAIPGDDEHERIRDLRAEVDELVRQNNLDRALEVLVVLRALVPDDPAVADRIQRVKDTLVDRFARQLGGLDAVAPPIAKGAAHNPEMIVVARLVDGVSTVGDLCRASPFDQLRTLKILQSLYRAALAVTRDYAERDEPRSNANAQGSPSLPDPTTSAAPTDATERAGASFDFDATFQRGVRAYVQRQYDAALEAFELCLRERPLDRQVETMLNRVRAERGRSP